MALASSIVTIGVLSTLADREIDMHQMNRDVEPWTYGYISRMPHKSMIQLLSGIIAIVCHAGARMMSLGLLIVAGLQHGRNVWVAPVWVAMEVGLFAAYRIMDGGWHQHFKDGDVAVMNFMFNFMSYIAVSLMPVPIFRSPPFLGNHVYARALVGINLLNFPMLMIAYYGIGHVDGVPIAAAAATEPSSVSGTGT